MPHSHRIILLVEDNSDDAELTMRALKQHNVPNSIRHVQDGQEALDFLFRTGAYADLDPHPQPILVLLDLKMPRVGGIEVLKRVREDKRTQMIPIVILSSSAEESDIAAAYTNYANSYVRKAVDFESSLSSLRQISAYWLGINEPPPIASPN